MEWLTGIGIAVSLVFLSYTVKKICRKYLKYLEKTNLQNK